MLPNAERVPVQAVCFWSAGLIKQGLHQADHVFEIASGQGRHSD